MANDPVWTVGIRVFEVRIQSVHVDPALVMDERTDRIGPDRGNPQSMKFQRLYGLAPGQIHASRPEEIPDATYLSPDVQRARSESEVETQPVLLGLKLPAQT